MSVNVKIASRYLILNEGCHDTTYGIACLYEEELKTFIDIIRNLNKNSRIECQPIIQVFEINEPLIEVPEDCVSFGDFLGFAKANGAKDVLLFDGAKRYCMKHRTYRNSLANGDLAGDSEVKME